MIYAKKRQNVKSLPTKKGIKLLPMQPETQQHEVNK